MSTTATKSNQLLSLKKIIANSKRLCDYEVSLRDTLHFRKNLKREEWRAIAIHVSDRKRQGKESEVIWNNTRFKAKKVRKELLRNSQPKPCLNRKGELIFYCFCIARRHVLHICLCSSGIDPELPWGLVIRTPPRSPVTNAAVLLPLPRTQLRTAPANSLQVVHGGSLYPLDTSSMAYEDIREVQRALVEAGEFGVSPYRKLRENLPFNRCMSQLLESGGSFLTPLAPSPNFLVVAISRPLHFRIPTAETPTPVFPRLFGANPSLELFGRQVFRLSNNEKPNDIWFLDWIGISADFALLRAFFSINSPTAGAVYECLVEKAGITGMTHLLRVLFELRHFLSTNNSTSFNEHKFLNAAVLIGPRLGGNLDIVNSCLSSRSLLPVKTQQTTKSSVLRAACYRDIPTLRVLVDAGLKVDSRYQIEIGAIMTHIYNWDPQEHGGLYDYIELLLRGGVLDGSAALQYVDDNPPTVIIEPDLVGCMMPRDICPITWDELLMVCPPMMRKALRMAFAPFSGDQEARISKAGVFMVAQDGATRLQAYLEAHQDDDPFLVHVTLEECLLFTAILNDFKTAAALLEVGVDPHTGLLEKSLTGYQKGTLLWNPSTVAAAAGNLEVLMLLLGHVNLSSFLDCAPIHQLVQNERLWETREQSWMESRLRRLRDLRRYYLAAQAQSSELAIEDDVEGSTNTLIGRGRNLETLEYIRSISHSQDLGQKVDLEIIKAAVSHKPLSWDSGELEFLPSDVLLMDGLVDGHLEYEEEGMDLLHLSIRNHCSFAVVSLLSDKGFKVHSSTSGQDHTMLHDALLSESPNRSQIVEFLLENGADCKVCGEGLSILEASLWNCYYGIFDSLNLEYRRIFERLLNSGAPVHNWPRKRLKRWRPLICMLLDVKASDDLILRVVDAGAPLNDCGYGWSDATNATPLQAAVINEREGLARELIRRGADVHAPPFPQSGCTALQAACSRKLPIHFVGYLVDVLGVNVNEPPAKDHGLTSLAEAVESGSLNTVEFLLDHGADVNAKCGSKRAIIPDNDNPLVRPLDIAVRNGNLDMVELLLKAGGRSRDAGLGGAICIAAERGHYAVLSVLRSWDEKYRRRIVEQKASYQRQNPE